MKLNRFHCELLRRLSRNEVLLQRMKAAYLSCAAEDVWRALPAAYRPDKNDAPITDEFFAGDEVKSEYTPYRRSGDNVAFTSVTITRMNNSMENTRPQYTQLGKVVRSKSEAIIGSLLESFGVNYYYDRRVIFTLPEGGSVYRCPDFIIPCPDGMTFFWEHLGLLNDKNYLAENSEKLRLYALNGIMPGNNLIITSDDSNGSLDAEIIKGHIELFIMPHYL